MRRDLITSFLAVVAGAILIAAAYSKPNFTGEWKINLSKSDFGQLPPPVNYERRIRHAEPAIEMTSHQTGAQGEQTLVLKLRTDGRETVNHTRNGDTTSIGKWVGNSLQFQTKHAVTGGDLVSTDTWSLSGDGRTLTVNSVVATPKASLRIVAVFDRQ